jgi:ATP-dependent helicase/nuclease subunit A
MLDETDSSIWFAAMFDEVIPAIDRDIVDRLGYTWLRTALRELFADPFASEEALSHTAAEWQKLIEDTCAKAIRSLMSSDCWRAADALLRQYQGEPGDTLEERRRNVLNAMADIAAGRNIAAAFEVFHRFSAKNGAAGKWKNGGLDEVRSCLKDLSEAFKSCKSKATLVFGADEEELAERIDLLRRAFAQAREFLARTKLERGALDYGDLEYYALKILEDEETRRHYARRWKAILVDEFQDTNPVQERLLRALIGSVKLTVVGDEKQSIYRFRRADVSVFQRVRREIGKQVDLKMSYRTHETLIGSMNAVFERLLDELHQPLDADRKASPHDGPHIVAACATPSDNERKDDLRPIEARYIANEIARMLNDGILVHDKRRDELRPVRPSDIAILSRTRGPMNDYIEALTAASVPAVNAGGGNLLETREVLDAVAMLTFACDQDDDIALAAILRGPYFAVSDRELYEISRERNKDETWWELLTRCSDALPRAYATLETLLGIARRSTAEQFLSAADELTGYSAVAANLPQGGRRLADIEGFLSLIRRIASMGLPDIVGSVRFLNSLFESNTKIPRPPLASGDAVTIMTIHGSKGLEWPVVFVPDLARKKPNSFDKLSIDSDIGVACTLKRPDEKGAIRDVKPSILTLIKEQNAQSEREESRRVLYVAVTRARDRVYLTAAGNVENDLAAIAPCLEAAGIPLETIQDAETVRTAAVGRHELTPNIQVEPVRIALSRIAATGLSEYDACPRRFKYRYIDGHPGLSDHASTAAMAIGSLAHRALELDLDTDEKLKAYNDTADPQLAATALELANNFRESQSFAEFRISNIRREVPITLSVGGVTVTGYADLVGPDFVLDFKTDSTPEPQHHALQLWAYAKALKKPRAVVAYLRHNDTYTFSEGELMQAEKRANRVLAGIADGDFDATSSRESCGVCAYTSICDSRFQDK